LGADGGALLKEARQLLGEVEGDLSMAFSVSALSMALEANDFISAKFSAFSTPFP
jgi:hypothetical protein